MSTKAVSRLQQRYRTELQIMPDNTESQRQRRILVQELKRIVDAILEEE